LIELSAEVGILFPEDTFTPRPMKAKTRDLSMTGGYFEVYDFPPELFAKLGQSVRSAKIEFPEVPELGGVNLYGKIVWLNYQKSKMVCALGVSYDHAPDKYHKFLEKQQATSSWS
ncbi:MAG: PilZ domain-containing protein, partial [bacterium]